MTNIYEKKECIGKGSFGEVYKAIEVATGRTVAIKLVDLEKADEEIEIIQREIKVMSQISNPHVVHYFTSLMKDSTLWIVMEFMSGGSVKELLDNVGPFSEDAIATVMKALCKGLDYVHKGRKLHRDIKAANILLSEHGEVKLADFGVAGQMTTTVRQRNTFVGSPFWMAPEVIQESLYDEKADIWSAGITAMELANGLPPYATEHPYRALFLIPKNDPPRLEGTHCSKAFKDFVALCLQKNPTDRPSAEHLLTHAFLRKARTSSIKELLRQKDVNNGEVEVEEKVVLGGDSMTGSLTASESLKSPSTSIRSGANTVNTAARFEFDFGSLDDSRPGQDDRKQPLASRDDIGTVTRRATVSGATSYSSTTAAASLSSPAEKNTPSSALPPQQTVEDADSGHVTSDPKETSAETCGSSVGENEVLTQLILPVIAQMRANVDTSGIHNDALMSSLGLLEVAFVDIESARPGMSTSLLESLMREARLSKSSAIRAMTLRSLQDKSTSK